VDLDAYRSEAEAFVSSLDREYYLHFSGQRATFEIEPIYDRHMGLFSRDAVEELREAGRRELLEFAVHGHIGRATKAEEAEVARREAALEVALDGQRMPFRQAAVAQANEPDAERRAALEAARLELTERELNPLLRAALERSHALARELGWPSMRALCQELSGVDLERLGRQTATFLDASEQSYESLVEPQLEEQLGLGFEHLRRSDLPAFFRAPGLDELFPRERLMDAFGETISGLGLSSDAGGRVIVDVEARPKKSPRAFCSPVRVPDEVYLVIAPTGGRDDFEALFHEAGHAYHYAHVDPQLAFEHRYLGDNAVTEGFAFLFQYMTESPAWLDRRLGVARFDAAAAQARAAKLVFLRRYAAKLGYELELHGEPPSLDALRAVYARHLSDAVHVDWPAATWLSDVDPFFYASCYLRAWALETHLRRLLEERFGEAWFEEREAGDLLRSLWAHGQRMGAEELLGELSGSELEFSALVEDLALAD
jgi:hypothetical protein